MNDIRDQFWNWNGFYLWITITILLEFYFIDRISFNSITFYPWFCTIPGIEISFSHINLFDPPTYILFIRLWEYSNMHATSVNDLAKHLACGEWLSADANDARNSWEKIPRFIGYVKALPR